LKENQAGFCSYWQGMEQSSKTSLSIHRLNAVTFQQGVICSPDMTG